MKKMHLIIVVLAFAAVLIGGYFGFRLYAENAAKEKLDAVIAEHADVVDIDYRRIGVGLPGMDVKISDILVAPVGEEDKLKINEVVIHDFDDESEIPEFLSVSINGIEVDLNELGGTANDLKKLGYEGKILINLEAAYIYQKEKRELKIDTLKIAADDVGEIRISLHVSNIGTIDKNLFVLLGTLSQMTVNEAKIVYTDRSLAERVLKAAAKEQDVRPEELKEMLIGQMDKHIKAEEDEFAKKMLTKVRDFIDDPDEFSISLVSEPRTVDRLMKEFQQVVGKYGRLPAVPSRRSICMTKQKEAKRGLGNIARNQEAYMAEHDAYSKSLNAIKFENKSKYYDFYVISADEKAYKIAAESKEPGITGKGVGDDVWTIDQNLRLINEINGCTGEKRRGITWTRPKPNASDTVNQAPAKKDDSPAPAADHSAPDKPSDIENKKPIETVQPTKNDSDQKKPVSSVTVEKPDEQSGTSVVRVSGIDLKSVFRRLENAGFKPGPYQEDDLSGLSDAVRRFQKFAKLEESGTIDASTWTKMKILYDPGASAEKGAK